MVTFTAENYQLNSRIRLLIESRYQDLHPSEATSRLKYRASSKLWQVKSLLQETLESAL